MIRTEPTAMTETDETPAPRLQSERINETRYTRTFTCQEIVALLLTAVLDEAGQSRHSHKRTESTVHVMCPGLPEELTVKVTSPEYPY